MNLIAGFDYRLLKGKPGKDDAPGTFHEKGIVFYSRKDWRKLVAEVLAAGGKRRFDGTVGETFLHAKGGKLLVEIYANIQPPKALAEEP